MNEKKMWRSCANVSVNYSYSKIKFSVWFCFLLLNLILLLGGLFTGSDENKANLSSVEIEVGAMHGNFTYL